MRQLVGRILYFLLFATATIVSNIILMTHLTTQIQGQPSIIDVLPTTNQTTRNRYEAGIDPAYIRILKEAERRSLADYKKTRPVLSSKGIVIGPTGGPDFRFTELALENAKRIRTIIDMNMSIFDQDIKLALITDKRHVEMLNSTCASGRYEEYVSEASCKLWANGSLFDNIIFNKKKSAGRANSTQTYGADYWITALSGYLLAPYEKTLFLDSDAYPCPGIGKLFYLLHPYTEKLWALSSTKTVDFAAGLEQWPSSQPNSPILAPGDPTVLSDWQYFAERNTGATLFYSRRSLVRTFMHFIPLVAEHMYEKVAKGDDDLKIVNDQVPFKVALYLFRKLNPDFQEATIPMHVSCRSYPNEKCAGIDGALNGMVPRLSNGSVCDSCHCSPCLISHFGHQAGLKLRDDFMGWEVKS